MAPVTIILVSVFRQIILPASSWAQWAGFLSNSTEIHVNTPPLHMVMSEMPQYIYHDERGKRYFGRYNITTKDLDFAMLPPPPPPEQDLTVPPAGAKTNSSITNAGNVTKPII